MRVIQQHKDNPKIYEVAWMWLPMFIAQNSALLSNLDHALNARFPPPVEVTEEKLDEIHDFVIEWVCQQIKIPGLEKYLQAMREVEGGN
jgi:hypothetical protein